RGKRRPGCLQLRKMSNAHAQPFRESLAAGPRCEPPGGCRLCLTCPGSGGMRCESCLSCAVSRVLGALLLSLYRPPSVTPVVPGLPMGLHGGQSLLGDGLLFG